MTQIEGIGEKKAKALLKHFKTIGAIKKANMDEWNKDVPFNKGEYKQYKITSNDYGTIFCRYYAMQISDVFGEYELFFPEYELAQFKAIADVPVEKE